MATTLDAVSDRVRSLLANSFVEAQTPFSFEQQPTGAIDGCFRVTDRPQRVIGGMGLREERFDGLVVWVARKLNAEPTLARRTLVRDMHLITKAVVRDGHITSGEYAISDEARTHEIQVPDGAEYAVLQLTLPVNFEVEL